MIDSKNNDTESPEDLPEEQASQLKVKDFGEEVGAVQFWRSKNYLQSQFPQTPYWSDDRWKAYLTAGG